MRKLKIIEHISLDGVIQVSGEDGDSPYGDWTAPYRTPAGRDAMIAAVGGGVRWERGQGLRSRLTAAPEERVAPISAPISEHLFRHPVWGERTTTELTK